MNQPTTPKPGLPRLGLSRRRSAGITDQDLVVTRAAVPPASLPLLVEPALAGVDLVAWASGQRGWIEQRLHQHGALLFRNFGIHTEAAFESFITATSGDALEYRERSSPRSLVSGHIYTSTDHPADQPIFLHNEHSYARVVPLRIFFFCKTPAEQGGETPVADCRRVLGRLPRELRDRFARSGYTYVRNFGDGFGLPWQTAFQTGDPAAVEAYCREALIEPEWKPGGRLRTRQVRPAIFEHPLTREPVWFNHATFFHVSTLPAEIRDGLLAQFGQEDLPNNTYYGDGSEIEPATLASLRQAYLEEKVVFPWRQGDILMLDNVLAAHGREPFHGKREIRAGMALPMVRQDLGGGER
jgi:alpha-ketoglutarate-dependent taurine dioxygenase